jgi:hypothetical protein
MDNFDLKKYLKENRFQPIFYDVNNADELDFSNSDEVSFIFNEDDYETDSDLWEDERFTITIDIDTVKNFLYNQSKNEITIPVLNGDGIIKLDKKYAESIMGSFYENHPYLDPTSPEYEGPGGFGLNEIKVNKPKNPFNLALGNLFYPEEDEEGMIEYYYDENKLVEFIKKLGYKDAEEIANEIMTISSPHNDLEMYRRIYNDPDLDMAEITLDMMKKSIENEFEK